MYNHGHYTRWILKVTTVHSEKNFHRSDLKLRLKIQQTKMLVTGQRFGDLFLFGLVWQCSSVQTKYDNGRFKFMATYL